MGQRAELIIEHMKTTAIEFKSAFNSDVFKSHKWLITRLSVFQTTIAAKPILKNLPQLILCSCMMHQDFCLSYKVQLYLNFIDNKINDTFTKINNNPCKSCGYN